MSTAADTFTEGQTVTVIAAPGYPTDAILTVIATAPRQITTAGLGFGVELYTLRRNGKYALKGCGQWQSYLRAVR